MVSEQEKQAESIEFQIQPNPVILLNDAGENIIGRAIPDDHVVTQVAERRPELPESNLVHPRRRGRGGVIGGN